jgi:hypothetical protein
LFFSTFVTSNYSCFGFRNISLKGSKLALATKDSRRWAAIIGRAFAVNNDGNRGSRSCNLVSVWKLPGPCLHSDWVQENQKYRSPADSNLARERPLF